MDTHEYHILDSLCLKKTGRFYTGIRYCIQVLNFNRINLTFPGVPLFAFDSTITTAVVLVNWPDSTFFFIQQIRLAGKNLVFLAVILLCQFPRRMVFVVRHTTAGSMHNQYSFFTCKGYHVVQDRRHFSNPAGSSLAPMLVPHVADNNGRLLRIPLLYLIDYHVCSPV